MPSEKSKVSEGVLKKLTSMCEEIDLDIADVLIDRAYHTRNEYVENSKNV